MNPEGSSIEQQLFSWKWWNDVEVGMLEFFHIKLKVNISPSLSCGTELYCALMDFQESTVFFFKTEEDYNNGISDRFDLKISVV